MLAKEVVAEYRQSVRFVEVDFGDSELARDHGITRYPAFFLAGALFAGPTDFYAWGTEAKPRYAPWASADVRAQFGKDLRTAIDAALAGETRPSKPARAPAALAMPNFTLAGVDGERIRSGDYAGKVTLIEFWATWCVPCAKTMPWLVDTARRRGESVHALTVAIDSQPDGVREWIERHPGPVRWALGDDAVRDAFGSVPMVPALFVFDRSGQLAGTFIGAAPENHADLERLLNRLDPRSATTGKPVADGIRAHVAALRDRASELPAERRSSQSTALDAVIAQLDAGRHLAALRRLGDCRAAIHAEQLRSTVTDVDDEATFDGVWRATMAAMLESEAALEAAGSCRSVLQAALVETAAQQARSYGRSARPYAKDGGFEAGLYYLGLARGLAEQSAFCRGLDLGVDALNELPLDPAAELARCDATNLTLVETITSQVRDRSLLAINATLKLARDQLRDGRPAGALHQALLVQTRQRALQQVAGPAPDVTALRTVAQDMRKRMRSRSDDAEGGPTLAHLLLEEAEAVLADPGASEREIRFVDAMLDLTLGRLAGPQ